MKRILSVPLAVLLGLSLMACSGVKESSAEENEFTANPSQQEDVTFLSAP